MTTLEILKKLKETQFDAENFEFLPWADEVWSDLEEVHSEETNPRRDYLGVKRVYKNKVDGKYFYVEEYGNDMAQEIYDFREVTPVEKTVTIYEKV